MTTPSFVTAEALGAAWQDVARAPLVPASEGGGVVHTDGQGVEQGARTPGWKRALRVARDLAIGVALIAALPLGVIGSRADYMMRSITAPVADRLLDADRFRVLRAPVDPSISAEMAGAALHRLQPLKDNTSFRVRPTSTIEPPWFATPLSPTLFVGMQSRWYGGPDVKQIITAASRGLSDAERTWLETLAKDPSWRTVDAVALAREADILGQALVTPFAKEARAWDMPVPSFARTRKWAYADIARAAYYVSIGDNARAERILRSVVSLGFVLMDNGFALLEGLEGRLIVDAGRDGLYQLYQSGYKSELLPQTEGMSTPIRAVTAREQEITVAELQARASAAILNPALPRSVRFGELQRLRWSACGSLSHVLFGSTKDVDRVFARARETLARNDAERAYVDLAYRGLDPRHGLSSSFPDKVVQGAAELTSALTGNPRIAQCTNALSSLR